MTLRIVETPLGWLRGRDAVYADSVTFVDRTGTLVVRGEINGKSCEHCEPDLLLPFVLRFSGVLAVRIVELDSWSGGGESSFDEVMDSPWIAELGGKVNSFHRHFVLKTYDEVFEVVCSGYDMAIDGLVDRVPIRLGIPAQAHVPAILALEAQGWQLEHTSDGIEGAWTARRGVAELFGEDPLQLLALAAITDARGTDWEASEVEVDQAERRFGLRR
jgi:hypothetical protein